MNLVLRFSIKSGRIKIHPYESEEQRLIFYFMKQFQANLGKENNSISLLNNVSNDERAEIKLLKK